MAETAQSRTPAPSPKAEDAPAEAKAPPKPTVVPSAPAQEKPAEPPKPAATPTSATVLPPARRAHVRGRHVIVLVSFLLFVLAPIAGAAWYLWDRAAPQFHSTVGFAVRTENTASPLAMFGGIPGLSASSSTDTDILYEYLQSQRLIADVDANVDLRGKWSLPENDPIFAFRADGSIEDLMDYWSRMVQINYDVGTGLIELRVKAFTPEDAREIAAELFDASSRKVNALSSIAQEDAVRYARQGLDRSEERLRSARQSMMEFRSKNQMIDPTADIKTQAGILGDLRGQLAAALIEVDLMTETNRGNDPRLAQANRRVEVIQQRIAAERRKLGIASPDSDQAFSVLVGEFERLSVEREFAERAYVASLASYDAAQAEAQRKSRYLAAYSMPTLAESSRFPQRWITLALIGTFSFLVWVIVVLVSYSIKDRR